MCSFSPSAAVRSRSDEKIIDAVGEMVRAAVKHFDPDHTGPVEFTICRGSDPAAFDPEYLKNTEVFDG